MLSGHRVHHRLIFDNVVPFVYLLFFVAQVRIHLVTRTIVVVLNIGIDACSDTSKSGGEGYKTRYWAEMLIVQSGITVGMRQEQARIVTEMKTWSGYTVSGPFR